MVNALGKFFKNDKVFSAMPFVFLVMVILDGVADYIKNNNIGQSLYYVAVRMVVFVAILIITISYKKHEKNVMKGLLGGVLLLSFAEVFSAFAYSLLIDKSNISYTILVGIWGILMLGITICHFILASDHKSNPKIVKVNQILFIITFLFNIAWFVAYIILYQYSILSAIANCGMVFAELFIIVAVEYRVDLFKQTRELNN